MSIGKEYATFSCNAAASYMKLKCPYEHSNVWLGGALCDITWVVGGTCTFEGRPDLISIFKEIVPGLTVIGLVFATVF